MLATRRAGFSSLLRTSSSLGREARADFFPRAPGLRGGDKPLAGGGGQNSTRSEGVCCVVLVHGLGGGGATAKSVANAASRGGVSGGGVGHGLDGGSAVRRRLGLSYPCGCSVLLQLSYPRGCGGQPTRQP